MKLMLDEGLEGGRPKPKPQLTLVPPPKTRRFNNAARWPTLTARLPVRFLRLSPRIAQ
jgi:hypothetical protein